MSAVMECTRDVITGHDDILHFCRKAVRKLNQIRHEAVAFVLYALP